MTQPVWITPAGDLGVFPAGFDLGVQLVAQPVSPSISVTYTLLNGTLPPGITANPVSLNDTGYITGKPLDVIVETTYTFTVRATDNFGNIRDRTFSIRVYGLQGVHITTPNGQLLNTLDSVYINYQIQVYNPVATNEYGIVISSGNLPPGLYMSNAGLIQGYPTPPLTALGFPTTETYNFSVQLISQAGNDSKSFSIVVRNQNINRPPNTRVPVILNNTPLQLPLDVNDPYYAYYLPEDNKIPTVRANEYFSFKILGHDFDKNSLTYLYGVLPPGLTGDLNTGWITGTPILPDNSISKYTFDIAVCKKDIPSIRSSFETYTMIVTNHIEQDIVWTTSSDLGIINNGSISELYLEATSVRNVSYILRAGSLPPNLTLLENGQITGRVPYQPTGALLSQGDSTTYTFTVQAYNPQFPVVQSTREFTLTVYQKFANPTDNIYLKATPNVAGRQIINSLLTNEQLIPTNFLYRPDDVYFGKASEVKYVHIYGVDSTDLSHYINAIQKNHYNRKLVLGEIKTAIARDSNNEIIYEVVYSSIIDDLVNPEGVSIPIKIQWPRKISMDQGPYYVSNDDKYTTDESIYTSYSPGYIRDLYPASLTNMRVELTNHLEYTDDQGLLPRWMTSQQADGNTLGFVQAWVIAYTLPGKSEMIKYVIDNYWTHRLNEIDFSVDRFIIDKSASFNYNVKLVKPNWNEFPGGYPTPDPMNVYDIPVLFPRKTILPKNIE